MEQSNSGDFEAAKVPGQRRLESIRRERTASQCVCCGSEDLVHSPAVLMPFVADRIFGWKPVVIDESWGLRSIRPGHAYSICKSLRCGQCGHLFCDLRFSDAEMAALYNKYREEAYTALRESYEPGYAVRNSALKKPIQFTAQTEAFLEPLVESPLTILDWGGDTGLNTPFKGKSAVHDVYDISDKDVELGARRVSLEEAWATKYRLIVCAQLLEHVSYPSDILLSVRQSMDASSVLYIELPYEDLMRRKLEAPELEKRHWHEHINFYSERSLRTLIENCGLRIIAENVLSTNVAGSDVHIFQIACQLGDSEDPSFSAD